jgi:U-box domain.
MEAITATISLIQEGILDKYEEESSSSSNQSLHNEIKYFRKLLNSIKGILQDIRQQLVVEQEKTDYNHKNNTSFLKRPLLLLDDAVKEGGQVLEECSRAKNLRVHIFSKTYLGKLNGASAKMKDAMQLLTAVDITLDGSIQENLKDLNDQFHLLQQTIQHHHHEVADLFVQQQQDAFQDGIIIRRLIDLDLGTSESDIQGQMQEIADRADELRREKTFVDDQILKRVQDMSLLVNRQYSLSSKSLLLCPISMEVMKDPVLLSPSGHTYDRESICQSLLIQPDVCPVTNKRYDKQLTFTSNIGLRQVLMATYGDSAYQSYDDTWFWPRYHALWKEKQQVHSHDLAYSSYPATGNMEDLYKRVEVLLYGLHRESINDKEAELLVNYHLSDSIMIAFKSFILWRRNKTDPAIDVFAKYALLQGLARISESGNRIAQNLLGNFYLNGASQDMLLLSSALGICMNIVRVLHRIIQKQWNGTKRLPARDMLLLSSALGVFMNMVLVFHRIIQKQWNGTKRLQVRDMPLLNTTVGICMVMVLVFHRIIQKQWFGTKRLPARDMLLLSSALDICIVMVLVFHRIIQEQWNGTKRLRTRDTLLLKTTLVHYMNTIWVSHRIIQKQ